MKNIKVVIGANFGDEGKGLITDYLAHSMNRSIVQEGEGLNRTCGINDDGICSYGSGIVVRFNGGAQAGHTVTAPDGRRHVFGHYCSGSFAGLPGYLSEFFVVNPILFLKEFGQLENIGAMQEGDALYKDKKPENEFAALQENTRQNIAPQSNTRQFAALQENTMQNLAPQSNTKLYVDRNCMVTTPYDVMINQIAEISRGISKHGSCGVGFNETITRCMYDEEYRLCVNDLKDEALMRRKLERIRSEYMNIRLQQLGITSIPENYTKLLVNNGIPEGFIVDAAEMLRRVEVTDIGILERFDNIIFEGAQGLLLDQSHEYFPHVTRSNTGIKNVVELIAKAGIYGIVDGQAADEAFGAVGEVASKAANEANGTAVKETSGAIKTGGKKTDEALRRELGDVMAEQHSDDNGKIEVIYVTRAYMTRHGAGPFPTELPDKPYPGIIDMTNVPNPYQDVLRYGLMDIDALNSAIMQDMINARDLSCKVRLAVTCLDQLEEEVDFIIGQEKRKAPVDEFLRILSGKIDINSGYLSYGPTRDTVIEFPPKND